jgi:hypothetical protein
LKHETLLQQSWPTAQHLVGELQHGAPAAHLVVPHVFPHWPPVHWPPQHFAHAPSRGHPSGQAPVLQQRFLRQTQPVPSFVQSRHVFPPEPQALSFVPDWQVPVGVWQQPFSKSRQSIGSQTHFRLSKSHFCVTRQMSQIVPGLPQKVGPVPSTQRARGSLGQQPC